MDVFHDECRKCGKRNTDVFFCVRFVKMKFNAGGFALKSEYRTRIFVLTDNVQGTLILNKTPFDSVPEHVCTDICSTQFVYEPWGTEYPL